MLTLAELRAILAHELAHLARGDATGAARSARFVEALGQALDQAGDRVHGPLGAWARTCRRWAARLIAPIARGQELRADRSAAAIAGGSAAASALVKVALVQPLFREVLEHYDPNDPEAPNLYAFFRTFWFRLPPEIHTEMRLSLLANGTRDRRPRPPPPARPPRPGAVLPRPLQPPGRHRTRHHRPRRPRVPRAGAPQPPLRGPQGRAERLPQGAGVEARTTPESRTHSQIVGAILRPPDIT